MIGQGEALLQETRAAAQAEVACLRSTVEATQAEVERLMADPAVCAYLDYREAQEQAEREAREQVRRGLEARLAALRPGAALGQGTEALEALAAQAGQAGFPDLATEARDAAEAAGRMVQAQAQAEAALRRRRLVRWAEGRAGQAQPGDFAFVLDEEAGTALHLRPLPAHSGRLRFQVVAALGVENHPGEYGDVPARGRAWRWRNPRAGDPEGLSQAQAGVVVQVVQGRLRSGWSINRANARLARQSAGERRADHRPHETESAQSAEGRDQAQIAASVPQPAESALQPPEAVVTDDLAGLSPQVTARLRRVGLRARAAIEEMLAAGESVFLALPGVGPATLAVVQDWLSAPAPTHVTEGEAGSKPEEQATVEVVPDEAEAGSQPRAEVEALAVEETKAAGQGDIETEALSSSEPPAHACEPAITVEGDGVSGQRLAGWRGVAQVGLLPVARRLGFEEIQVLVHEDQGLATLVVYWPGGETTLSCPADGRAGQMKALRAVIEQIHAQIPAWR